MYPEAHCGWINVVFVVVSLVAGYTTKIAGWGSRWMGVVCCWFKTHWDQKVGCMFYTFWEKGSVGLKPY